MSVAGRHVMIAGATSASGLAAARALIAAGARVVAVGRDPAKLRELRAAVGSRALHPAVCDLTDERAVTDLTAHIHKAGGPVTGCFTSLAGGRAAVVSRASPTLTSVFSKAHLPLSGT